MIGAIIGVLGILVSILTYFLGRKDGRKKTQEDYILSRIDKMVDLYNEWDRAVYDNGIHALTRLGLESLENHRNIEKVIAKIEITSGQNPFGSQITTVKDIDLYRLFKFIREHNIDVSTENLTSIIRRMNAE
ncbi:MAG: hypothetical protein HC888_09235 [Candidatus Competibacteraceae bacterium]|nr:hypothetical protein [Candidatus Competibacteraceae bacterium]